MGSHEDGMMEQSNHKYKVRRRMHAPLDGRKVVYIE